MNLHPDAPASTLAPVAGATRPHAGMAQALGGAAARGELHILYQPVANLLSGKISGMEALLRWNSPEWGAVSPATFIPVAEESGLIDGMGLWALRKVCEDIRALLDRGIDVPYVAVNMSPIQFRDPHLLAHVQRALEDQRIEAHRIHIEITETTLMNDVNRCETVLHGLRALGLRLSLDDFGTGYSSLSYLKRYPFNKVKIDQSFVRDIGTSRSDEVIVNVIVAMAHGLGLEVIAEGVETEEQCEFMRTSVCDEIQGYFFSRPVDLDSIAALMLEGRQLPAHLLRLRARQRSLLLVDDEPNVLSSLKRLFRRDGHLIYTANGGAEGLEILAQYPIDVIMSDQRMPGMTGVEFLRAAKAKYPETIRIILSGYAELQYVTEAINEGAIYRFLSKPWDDEQLREQVQKAFEHSELQEKNQQLDMKIRATNRDLVAINRQLSEVIETHRQQIDRDEVSLAIAREALQCMPIPIIGVDDAGMIVLANAATETLFAPQGPLIGVQLVDRLPALASQLDGVAQGADGTFEMQGTRHHFTWRCTGQPSRCQGRLILLSTQGNAD